MNQEKIGKFIAKLRKENNLTQEQLATKLGITKNAVSKWERGLGLMDLALLKPLSEILGISVTELLNGEKITNDKAEKITNKVLENTIEYTNRKLKKNKVKSVIITILVIFFMVGGSFFSYKLYILNKYTLKKPKDALEVTDGLKIKKVMKIYKKTINDGEYLLEDDIKIRNDFKDYKREAKENEFSATRYLKYKNNKIESGFYISKIPQYIDIFVRNDLTFYTSIDNNENFINENYFNAADRKYFLLKNDINDDIDFLEYIRKNYYKENNLLMSKREMMENYAFNLFTSIIIPKEENITLITGDYNGYIYNLKKTKEIHIIRNNNNYVFMLIGNELIDDGYIKDLFSTLEIK